MTIPVTMKAVKTAGSGAAQLSYWQIQNGASVIPVSGTSYLDPYAQNKLWTAITVNPPSGSMVPNLATAGYTSTINPYVAVGNGGQCVAFVWGRMYEALGITLRQDNGPMEIPVARRQLLGVSGISKSANIADVEFTWRWVPINPVGAALYDSGVRYRSTVGFRSYDDGWRVVDQSVPSNQTLDEALRNAQPTTP